MSFSHQELEDQILVLIRAVGPLLPEDSFAQAHYFIDHNEFDLALDTVGAILAKAGVRVDASVFATFIRLGSALDIDDANWDAIRPLNL